MILFGKAKIMQLLRRPLSCFAAILCMALLPISLSQAAKPAKLEGMPYPKARKIILGYGWAPFKGDCLENEGPEVCGQFPELINCTQGQPEFCILRFSKTRRCLQIITRGGYLEDNGGTSVEQVSFIDKICERSL